MKLPLKSFAARVFFSSLFTCRSSRNAFAVTFLSVLLSACSSLGSNSKTSIDQNIQQLRFSVPVSEQRVIIYNHGINRPQQTEPCYLPYNRPPRSLIALADHKTMVYRLCSTATEAPSITTAGKQVYLRKIEINFAIDAFLSRGIQPKHIFLSGHSNGGWTSLMMMRDVNQRFNAAIVFAPAFAGKRSEVSFAPWWRNTVRPKQIKDMLRAPSMDALVFAYEGDAYNRPQDLQFLADSYPLLSQNSLIRSSHSILTHNKKHSSGVDLVSYSCGLRNAHQTFRRDCRLSNTVDRIRDYIDEQIRNW